MIIYLLLGSNKETQNSQDGNSSNEGKSKNNEESSGVDGSSQNSSNTPNESKIKYELKQASILTAETRQIDWDYIKINTELLYSNWTQTILDLYSLGIENEDILAFGNTLDYLTIASKNEDKVEILKQISILFSHLPKYEQRYSDDIKHINIQYTKYFILNSYYLAEENKWTQMKESINSAKDYFSSVLNNTNDDENEQNKICKIYVLLNELDNSINLQDKDIFYIKYKALMTDLSNI